MQTLARPRRLARLYPDFATVIVDEAHHAAAYSYELVLEYLGAFDPGGPLVVGLTATPQRSDKIGLQEIFERVVCHRTILDMIREGYLCNLRGLQVALDVDFGRLAVSHGDYRDDQLEEVLLAKQAPALIVQAWQQYAEGRKTLVFTPTVAVSEEMAKTFVSEGIAAASFDGTTPLAERRAMLKAFEAGEITVLCNCGVLLEGYDEPSIACVIMARPTRSQLLYIQMIGRGTRTFPGKDDCLIIDVVGNSRAHGLRSLPELFGLPLDALRQQTVTEALQEYSTKGRPVYRGAKGPLVVTPVDLFVDTRRAVVRWVTVEPQVYGLPLGRGGYVVVLPYASPADGAPHGTSPHASACDVVPSAGPARSAYGVIEVRQWGKEATLKREDLPLSQALGWAETFARQHGGGALMRQDSAWLQESAALSPKMCQLARRRGLADPERRTKGEVSTYLDRTYLADWLAKGTAVLEGA